MGVTYHRQDEQCDDSRQEPESAADGNKPKKRREFNITRARGRGDER